MRATGALGRNMAAACALAAAVSGVTDVAPTGERLDAAPVTCGMIAVTDVRLTEDLSCGGTAITVGADGIEIDLAGHTLSVPDVWSAAIVSQREAVTVRDGTVMGRIDLEGSSSATVTGVTLVGADLRLGSTGFVHRNRIVSGSLFMDTVSGFNLVLQNALEEADITVDGGHNIIQDNILRSGSISNLEGSLTSVIGNTVSQGAIRMHNAESSTGIVVLDNRVDGSPGDGISFGCRPDSGMASIARNKVTGSVGHGISTQEDCAGKVTLGANHATDNGGCGIHAPGVIDAGHNKAKRNADPEQCVGVACG
jgi:hypothetical protein